MAGAPAGRKGTDPDRDGHVRPDADTTLGALAAWPAIYQKEPTMNLIQVERLLRDHGLRLLRQESSHYVFGDDHGGRLVVAAHRRSGRVSTPRWHIERELRRLRASP
jgi:predicted RNA binding protein YcfA (HicA-like mRNA interferase family)